MPSLTVATEVEDSGGTPFSHNTLSSYRPAGGVDRCDIDGGLTLCFATIITWA